MKRGTYVANTIYNILLLEFYFIHPISTVEAPTAYSKYGPRRFLAYVADNLHHLYATGYIALAGWAGWASVHTLERWFRRDFCVTERSCAAAILEVDRHISDRFLCHFLARYEQVFILWKLIAFHVDMITDPVLCWLSLKEASVEERTMILHKVLIALFQPHDKIFTEFTWKKS